MYEMHVIISHQQVILTDLIICTLYMSFYYWGQMWQVSQNEEWVPKNNPLSQTCIQFSYTDLFTGFSGSPSSHIYYRIHQASGCMNRFIFGHCPENERPNTTNKVVVRFCFQQHPGSRYPCCRKVSLKTNGITLDIL